MDHSELTLLFGGSCSERKVSVASAQHLGSHLPGARLWFWAASGAVFELSAAELSQHARAFEVELLPKGKPRYPSLEAALDDATPVETFVIALHGGAGEDGTVQGWMEERRLYFTASSAAASKKAFDKRTAKDLVKGGGGRVAEAVLVSGKDAAGAEKALLGLLPKTGRIVVKPVADGSSAGLHFAGSEAEVRAVVQALAKEPAVPYMAETFIAGRELTVGVLDDEGGPRALPCSEIVLDAGRSFDYAGKYLGSGTREITPAELPPEVAAAAGKLAVLAHQATGCRGYTRTDMIVDDKGPLFLEINNLPGLTTASFIPQQLHAAGISMEQFLGRQVALARSRYMVSEVAQVAAR